ncbi:FecR family protein [Pedobacter sp. MC2016-24]|uniref:FecR family protein n=1 Tax=Pedobacter sp. MC2016-24 TaxID=2780090 RepID=UPI00188063E3|nr:FecR domain-containing protein [Pedobacter sp. MC2016-24]MBE9601299.1 FecR domain-containing protein [Pedobacter sp. MC2016-24]
MNHSEEPNQHEALAAKWIDKTISPEQAEAFNSWYDKGQDQPLVIPADFVADAETHKERIYQKVLQDLEVEIEPARKLWWRMPLIAAVLLILTVVVYFYVQTPVRYDLAKLARSYSRGSKIAVWYKADGTEVLLKDSVFMANLQSGHAAPGSVNKLVTPNGSSFKVILQDGTKVWLEAGSSLIYPPVFDMHKRVVQLSGEAHFEVTHQAAQPFHVEVRNRKDHLDVEVTGTKFDVMGYPDDEEIRTHVFEGSVKVRGGGAIETLIKGEQISFDKGFFSPKVLRPEKEWLMWKTQLEFDNEDLRQVVRKIARSYNMDVAYAGRPGDMRLSGMLRYRDDLKKTLYIIEAVSGCRFEIKGDTIVVLEYPKPAY